MALSTWVCFLGRVSSDTRGRFMNLMHRAEIHIQSGTESANDCGVAVFEEVNPSVLDGLRLCAGHGSVLAIFICSKGLGPSDVWSIPHAGARDLLIWHDIPTAGDQVVSRLQRWDAVRRIVESPRIQNVLVGQSPQWRSLVASVAEVAAFTQSPV